MIAAVVTVLTSLGWIGGLRDGVRGVMQLGPRKMNPVLLKLHDVGTLLLLGVALVISAGASLVFGTAADWVAEQLSLDPLRGRAPDHLRQDRCAAAAGLGHRADHVPAGGAG